HRDRDRGEEGVVAELGDRDLLALRIDLVEDVGEQVVGHRPRRRGALKLHQDRRRLGVTDPDRQELVAIHGLQQHDRLLADHVEAHSVDGHPLHRVSSRGSARIIRAAERAPERLTQSGRVHQLPAMEMEAGNDPTNLKVRMRSPWPVSGSSGAGSSTRWRGSSSPPRHHPRSPGSRETVRQSAWMSHCRQQAFIEAPPPLVWNLLADIDRHDEWWAGMVEVECDGLEAGCTYRQVNTDPFGREQEETFRVEQMEDCEELSIRCLDTGTFVRFALTEAQGGTFVDGEA